MFGAYTRVITISKEEIVWPFSDQGPHVLVAPRHPKGWKHQVRVDPFPGYPHDKTEILKTADLVETAFPIAHLPNYYIMPFEEVSRSNGSTSVHNIYDYDKGGKDTYEPFVILSGKRIPPHPAMSRYLVAHEYGHCVKYQLEDKKGIDSDKRPSELYNEYASLRGLPDPALEKSYGGQNWHRSIGELFANDFRILVCGVELEFWPHPGFERPEDLPEIVDYWQHAVAEYTEKPQTAIFLEPQIAESRVDV